MFPEDQPFAPDTHRMTDARSCPHCGQPAADDDVFCAHCGGALSGAPEEDVNPWTAVLAQLEAVTRGRFTIEHELGQGGMAAVYLAHDVSLHRKIAIKVLSPAMLMERGMVSRFKQEAVTIAALRHPSIVTVHAVEHHELLHFFVLDFVEGGSLEGVLARYGPLPIPAVQAWLAQVASALEYAHRRNVVHRDIKPGNVLLDQDGNAIVTDFGIAKVAEKSGLTQTGTTMGTPSYMSPEQCLARPVGPASDQYSLGIVAYQMLTGRVPFEGSALEVMRAQTDLAPPALGTVRPDCPPALADAVARMLEKDPAARWPNLVEATAAAGAKAPGLDDPIWEQLAGLVRGDESISTLGSQATPTTPLPGREPVPARRARRAGLVGAGIVAAAVVVGGVFALRGRGGEPSESPGAAGATLDILPRTGVLEMGDSARLNAVLHDSAGADIDAPAATWTSSDEDVATISDGMLYGHGPGRVTITAQRGGLATNLEIEVTPPGDPAGPQPPGLDSPTVQPAAVASVRVTPGSATIAVGNTRALDAVGLDAAGRQVPGSARWTVRDPAIAGVSANGTVTARAAGTTTVVATIAGRRGSATVTVTGPAETAEAVGSVTVTPDQLNLTVGEGGTLAVTVTGTRGSRLTDRAVSWQSSNAAVATVGDDGRVTAVSAGVAVVTATAGGRTAQTAVTVRAAAPALSDAEAGRLIRQWIEGFATRLDAAIRAHDLAAVRRAYETPMGRTDTDEWQRRLAVPDARWEAKLARAYDAQRAGNTWLGNFELTIVVQASGQRSTIDQRFSAVFEPAPDGGLNITSLVMLLADR